MNQVHALRERRASARPAKVLAWPDPSPKLALALRAGFAELSVAAHRSDGPAVHDAAARLADLAQRHALFKVRWQARALLGWQDDERASAQRLAALLDGLGFAIDAALAA